MLIMKEYRIRTCGTFFVTNMKKVRINGNRWTILYREQIGYRQKDFEKHVKRRDG